MRLLAPVTAPCTILPRYNEAISTRDCPLHRAARARAQAMLGSLPEALEDYDIAVQNEQEVGQAQDKGWG